MSFPFCDPLIPSPGLIHSGWRGFGGLAISPDGKFVPHFNLAAFTDRRFVDEYGFVEGLIPPRLPERTWLKFPGHFKGERSLNKMREHNLLATRKTDDEVIIWTVNESSDRTFVEEFKTTASYEDEDFVLSRDVRVSHTYTSDAPIEQLKTCSIANKSLWIRQKRKLCCLSNDFSESNVVFQSSIKTFEEHNYLEGVVIILDSCGMLWTGDIGHTLGRTKNRVGDCLNLVTQSEHPRVLYGADDFQIRTVDIREDTTSKSRFIFEVPKITHRGFVSGEYVQTPITQLRSLPHREHFILALNDRQCFLIDERYPRAALLTQEHSIPHGSHVLLCAEPYKDSLNEDSFIHNQFFLDHGCTGIWISSVYEQKSNLFSSIRPVHQLREPIDALSVLGPPKASLSYKADLPPRAISIVQGFKDKKNRSIDILVRSLDDGAVLYSKLLYGDVELTETQTAFKKSRRRFLDWIHDSEAEMETWGHYYQPIIRDNGCETISVHFDVPEMDDSWDPTDSHPLDFKPLDTGVGLKALVPSHPDSLISSSSEICGFRGTLGCSDINGVPGPGGYDAANLAQTYSSLLSLAIVGDDFTRVDKSGILATIRKSQKDDGSFWSQGPGSESDMRFVYCAVAICHILGDDSAIDWDKLGKFIHSSFNYDGGLGQLPGNESHGGSTYCAVASLALANKLWDQSVLTNKEIERLIKWALWKQNEGFHGRAHKPDDSCYAFWIGATLEILNAHPLANQESLRKFLMVSQHNFLGGFCKVPEEGSFSDILHTYFSIAALSLLREPTFGPVYAPLNVSRRAYENILRSQKNMK